MSTVTTMAKFAEIEVCGKAFRLLKTHDSPIAEADTVHCIELGRAWDMESQTYTDNALSEANERFRQAEEALAARVQEAQTSKTELDSTTMPTQQNKEEILESQRARDEMMKPLLDKQYAEDEQAPRDQQFWVVTIMRTSILVHSAHADSTSGLRAFIAECTKINCKRCRGTVWSLLVSSSGLYRHGPQDYYLRKR